MSCEEKPENLEPLKFAQVLDSEMQTITAQRESGAADKMQLAGLAFSGGGIRSAVFNLGFIQGLANRNSLHVFDYLSTVSGGGYIGGWLSALLKRESGNMPAGEKEMTALQGNFLKTRLATNAQPDATGFPESESKPIRFLRRYSNYLTPRLGLSGDTLALFALMVRNVAVIQFLLVSMLVMVFAGLLLVRQFGIAVESTPPHLMGVSAAIVMLFIYTLYSALRLQGQWGRIKDKNPAKSVTLRVLVPALSSGLFAAIALDKIAPVNWGVWGAMAAALLYVLAWGFATQPGCKKAWVGIFGGAVTLAALLYALLTHSAIEHVLAFAPPFSMVLFSLVITVHLALAGVAISEQNREWWARLGGQGMFLALGWMLAFTFLLYVPPLMQSVFDKAAHWLFAGGGLWAALTWIGTNLAQSKDSGAKKSAAWQEILVLIVPWFFLAGLLGLVAWLFVKCLPGIVFGDGALVEQIAIYNAQLDRLELVTLLPIAVISGLLFSLLLKYVDLNLFSAHSFYVNRLSRTFMGASQAERHPNPYSGFDPADDLALSDLAGQRPIHLINATLNLTGGEDLAWQTRRGACFTFTPCYAGYSTRNSKGEEFGGFRPTSLYAGGLSLATTVAVSGAAASPNMGFHTATSVAALLTAFNLRLARWCPNPQRDKWSQNAPKTAALPLFSELFGDTSGKKDWVNLSDGGHFENLGLYELIRRRTDLILVTDVAADGDYRFDDLAMAVRKIGVDFGVHVEIDEARLDKIRPDSANDAAQDTPFSRKHWAFGRIHYPPPERKTGYLIYVKSSIAADAPIDIRQYRDAHPAFPHETTADQWFDEDQFEAYRHLGQIIAEKLLDSLPVKDGTGQPANEIIDKLYRAAQEYFADSPNAQPPQGEPS